jgi:hypothetical protein
MLLHVSAFAKEAAPLLQRKLTALRATLPVTWSVVEQRDNEYPWGHHFCWQYSGPRGTKVVVSGPAPVAFHYRDQSGAQHTLLTPRESLEVWLMPSAYRDRAFAWRCFKRPVQPVAVVATPTVVVFARPSAYVRDIDALHELARTSSGTWWQSVSVSWVTWEADIRNAIQAVEGQ